MRKISTEADTDSDSKPFPSLDERVGHLLRRAYQKASANLARRLRDSGLTVPRYAVLHRLREFGPVSQNKLGRLVAMEPGNIHDIVRSLKAKKLITTQRDPDDSRRRLVELTATGTAMIDDLIACGELATRETLAPLNADEQRTLKSLLARIADS